MLNAHLHMHKTKLPYWKIHVSILMSRFILVSNICFHYPQEYTVSPFLFNIDWGTYGNQFCHKEISDTTSRLSSLKA
uniref:Uncharacterized protein n=1 Tax=Arundo donax TaxID=35708 RepID=A0A0A8ZJU8_ARUDO